MIVSRKFRLHALWTFAWPNLTRVLLWSTAVTASYRVLGWTELAVPFLPIATIGTAVAFYVGFKNNASYDRLWEARKIWGAVVNASRIWAYQVRSLVGHQGAEPDAAPAEIRRLVRRQVAWVHALRIQLRRSSALNTADPDLPQYRMMRGVNCDGDLLEVDDALARFCDAEDRAVLKGVKNTAARLLDLQAKQIADLKRRGLLDGFEHRELMSQVVACVECQGKAERIKNFPFPRQYANFSGIFVHIFSALLPFGLLESLADLGPHQVWLTIPFTALVSWVFYSMEQVGDASEDPFESGVNDVPMSAICRTIEIELRDALGEQDLPPPLAPVEGLIL